MTLEERIQASLRDVKDFPKPGILFKDITPLLQDANLSNDCLSMLEELARKLNPDLIIGVESRGFLFGLPLAMNLDLSFVPVRKKGKLPAKTISYSYDLEYGSEVVEVHADAIKPGSRVLIHDDVLATGGTARAAAELVKLSGGVVCGYAFLVEIGGLGGRESLGLDDGQILNLAAC